VDRFRLSRGDRDVAHAGVAGDEAACLHAQGCGGGDRTGVQLLPDAFRAGETHQPLHAAQRCLLVGPLLNDDATVSDPGDDLVERLVVVDVPTDRGHVLGGPALQQQPAFVVVQTEPHAIATQFVDVQADAIGPEAAPVTEPPGLDAQIS
jgi:hypothetical protein